MREEVLDRIYTILMIDKIIPSFMKNLVNHENLVNLLYNSRTPLTECPATAFALSTAVELY